MSIITKFIHIITNGENEMINITKEPSKAVNKSNLANGIAVVFVIGSSPAITTIEFEPGL